jgi:hypothetical protein
MSPIVTLLAAGEAGDVRLDAEPVGTVAYWLARLCGELDARRENTLTYEAYMRGDHPLQFATSKYRETFGSLFAEFADNWCPLVVDASVERLKVIGFRFGAEGGELADREAWNLRWLADDPERVSNPFSGIVPVIPVRNAPQMIGGGTSDLAVVIDTQNAINKLCTDMMVAAEYAAFRQRWATGVEIPPDPNTGQPDTGKWLSSVSRMWTVPAPDAKFGDFNVTDLTVYVRAIEMHIQHLAARTRTPPHYLLGQSGAFPSGESLKATETGLVAKVRRKQVDFGEAWEEAMRLAFLAIGDTTRAQAIDAEVLWADPESRSEGERVDALVKLAAIGVPEEALWARVPDVTPQTIARWRDMAEEQARRAGVAAGPPAAPTAPPELPPAPSSPPSSTP